MNRRRFLINGSYGLAAVVTGCRESVGPGSPESSNLLSRPGTPTKTPVTGRTALELATGRDGFLFVPEDYSPSRPASLLVLLHGASQNSSLWSGSLLTSLYGPRNIVVLAPDSRRNTWDIAFEGFGVDVEFIDRALAYTFDRCVIDPSSIALGGFSDGASYALSLGVSNGDLFSHLIAYSPGFFGPGTVRGKPKIFVSHGTGDQVLPFSWTSTKLVPDLISQGYDVKFVQFAAGHTVPLSVATQATEWFKP